MVRQVHQPCFAQYLAKQQSGGDTLPPLEKKSDLQRNFQDVLDGGSV